MGSNDYSAGDSEIDVRKLLLQIWAKRHIILLTMIISMVIAISAKLYKISDADVTSMASLEVIFTFPNVEKGTYPNGHIFSITNLLSPSILDAVYEREELSKYGIDRFKLLDYIEITPFTPNREFIDAKYKPSLSDRKKMTQVELEEINSRYKQDLDKLRFRYAKLTFAVPDSYSLPDRVLISVLNTIPEIWARESIDTYGVLNVGIAVPGRINLSYIEEDYIVAGKYLKDFASLLLSSAGQLQADNLAKVLVDNETGFTATDIATEIGALKRIKIQSLLNAFTVLPVSKDYDELAFYLESRVAAQEENYALMKREADVIAEIFSQYTHRALPAQSAGQPMEQEAKNNMRTIQLGDAFLSQLLSIGDEMSDAKFEQALLDKQLNVRLESEKIVSDIVRLKTSYNNIESLTSDEQRNRNMTSIVESQINRIVLDLEMYRAALSRIADLRTKRVLSDAGAMYNIVSQPAIDSNFNTHAKALAMALFFSTLLGVVLGLFFAMFAVLYESLKDYHLSCKGQLVDITKEIQRTG